MNLLPAGILGLVFAALIAAAVGTLASMINLIGTIFTLDLYAKFTGRHSLAEDKEADGTATSQNTPEGEKQLVLVGQITAVVTITIAAFTARPLLGGSDQAFQFIQEFSGFFTPGITVIFLLGLFWKKASEAGALGPAVASVGLSYLFKALMPNLPFIDRMGIVFLAALAIAVVLRWQCLQPRARIGTLQQASPIQPSRDSISRPLPLLPFS